MHTYIHIYIYTYIHIYIYTVIGSASPDPDNSPKRRQLLRIFSQCHQQKGLIQLRSQAWKGGEDSPQLLLWNSRKLPRLLFQNCEPCHTRENLWLQGGKPYTHPLTWLPRSRCLWSERCRMRPSCVMQRLLNLEQMMVGPKWMVMLYIGKSHSQKLLFSDFIWWDPSAWEKGPGHCSRLWPVSTIEFCLWCLPEL